MTTTAVGPGLLALPVELRLQIFEHVIDQETNVGLVHSTVPQDNETFQGLVLDPGYFSAASLDFLLVCRQLRVEVTDVAFRRTTFVVREPDPSNVVIPGSIQHHQLENLRSVVLMGNGSWLREITSWTRWPFNAEPLRLDQLTIVFHHDARDYPSVFTCPIVTLLRRLEHVKRLKFVQNATLTRGQFQAWYNRLVGLMLKEDHYQRYDAPGAPHVEATWWDWDFDSVQKSFVFGALPGKAVIPEPDYIESVGPLVAKLMTEMETVS